MKRIQSVLFGENVRLPRTREMLLSLYAIRQWFQKWKIGLTCHCFTWADIQGEMRVRSMIDLPTGVTKVGSEPTFASIRPCEVMSSSTSSPLLSVWLQPHKVLWASGPHPKYHSVLWQPVEARAPQVSVEFYRPWLDSNWGYLGQKSCKKDLKQCCWECPTSLPPNP